MECIICEIHSNNSSEIIQKTDHWVIRRSVPQKVEGYLILEPKRHLTNWGEFSSQELIEMGNLIQELEAQMIIDYKAERVYVVTISEVVRHLHLHIIPRASDSELKGLPLIQRSIN